MLSEKKKFEDLMIDYFSGTISESDQQLLTNLINSNNDFKAQFDEMTKLRAVSFIPKIESGKQTNYNRLIQQINEESSMAVSHSWTYYFRRIAAVITLVLSVSIASFYLYKDITAPKESTICYETIAPIGSQTKIILPDSTVVWLNSGSSLKYSQTFDKKDRQVSLSGEGYFEVTKNKEKPFFVHTGSLDVKVTGTVFNVKSYKEDKNIEVNLLEGVVSVTFPEKTNSGSYTMKPNEKIVFNKILKTIELSETDASRSALWTTGKLCFVDVTIEEISKDLERKFHVKIQIKNEKIKNELFSGSLNLNLSLKELLTYLDVDKKFKVIQVGDTINISSK
ncbi:MAG: FecR family protein [Paludibacter sp.]|nr:FecR family protein [Paludibacter sp.]